MTAVAVAFARGQHELAALRLVLGVIAALDRLEHAAPETRDELISLLTLDTPATYEETR